MGAMGEGPELAAEVERLRRRVAQLEAAERSQQLAGEELRRRVAQHTADLRCAEVRLQGSEARFRNIFEYSNDPILLIDLDRDEILDVNARACRLLGYTLRELQALPIAAVFPHDMARIQAFALSLVDVGFGWIDEVACQTRTGEHIQVEVSASEVPVAPDRHCVLALLRDITSRKATEARILASLQEKEILLREIHHRVKNNLQVVSSLFDLQAARRNDPEVQAMLRECRNRVRSMAAIHESLYQAHDLTRIDLHRYVSGLVDELVGSFGAASRVAVQVDIDQVLLDVDQAIPCGLIVNELVSNALKYAFAEGRRGRLIVGVSVGDDEVVLTVADDGPGLPPDLDVDDAPSLGLRLVHSLVGQLRGRLDVARGRGASFAIAFPLSPR